MFPFPSPLLMANAGPANDPYWANVVLLVPFNEANGATSFTDRSTAARALTTTGSVAATNSTAPTGQTTCGSFPNNGAVTAADSSDWEFGSGDFTVEGFFYKADLTTDALVTHWNGSTQHGWGLFGDPSNVNFFWSTTGADQPSIGFTTGFSVSAWHHIIFSRAGNTGYLGLDGVIKASGSMSGVSIFNSTANLAIGANNNGTTAFLNGGVAGLRITKGVGRISGSVGASYTVPTLPMPTS